MNFTEIIIYVVGGFSTIIGYYTNRLLNKVDEIEQTVNTHMIDDAKNLVSKNDLRELLAPMYNKLDNIEHFLRNRRKDDSLD